MSIWLTSGSLRVRRGGCWSGGPQFARVARRGDDDPGGRSNNLGVRLARRLP